MLDSKKHNYILILYL